MSASAPRTAAILVAVLLSTTACVTRPSAADRHSADNFGRGATEATVGGLLSGGGTPESTWATVTATARESVVRVRNRTCDGLATGSGFVISPNTVVTNAHVVRGGVELSLNTANGVAVRIANVDILGGEDLAVVHTQTGLPPPLAIAADDPVPGDLTEALGYPLGNKFVATSGRVVSYAPGSRYNQKTRVLESSVEIHPGNSGGPLIDAAGQVVGVVTAIDLEDGTAIAIPASRLRERLSAAERMPVTQSCF